MFKISGGIFDADFKHLANPDIAVERVTEWSGEIEEGVFMAAGEPWEIGIAEK